MRAGRDWDCDHRCHDDDRDYDDDYDDDDGDYDDFDAADTRGPVALGTGHRPERRRRWDRVVRPSTPARQLAFGHFVWTPADVATVGASGSLPLERQYALGVHAVRLRAPAPSRNDGSGWADGSELVVETPDGQAGVFKVHFAATPAHASQLGLWIESDANSIPAARIAGAGVGVAPVDEASRGDQGAESDSPASGDAPPQPFTQITKTCIVELHSGARMRLVLVSTRGGASTRFDPRTGGTSFSAVAELTIEQLPVAPDPHRTRANPR